MIRICKRCGASFDTSGSNYYCPACAAAARRENVYREHICTECSATFLGYPRSRYCPRCSAARRTEADKRYKKSGPNRPLGSTDICVVCGKEYTVESGRQRYCKACAKEQYRKHDAAAGRKWNAEHKDTLYPDKNSKRAPIRYCVVCGNQITSKTPTITCDNPECAKARRAQRQAAADYNRGHRSTPPEDYAPAKNRRAVQPQTSNDGRPYEPRRDI